MIVNLTAGQENTLTIVGTHFRVIESIESFKVRFEGGQRDQEITLERGMAFEPAGGFNTLRINSTIDQTINIEIVNGAIYDDRVTAGARTSENGKISAGAGVTTLIRAENPLRKSLLLQVASGGVYIGTSASTGDHTSANAGIYVGEFGTFETEVITDIYAYSAAGAEVVYIEESL